MNAQQASPHLQPNSADPHSATIPRLALVLAVAGAVLTWAVSFAGPLFARAAAALGDYGNIFTVTYIGLGVVVALDLAAVILGARGLRQRNKLALSGAAVGIGATGFIGLLVNLVLPLYVMPLITPHMP